MAIDISKKAQVTVLQTAANLALKSAIETTVAVQARKPVEMHVDPVQKEKAMRDAIAQINKQMADNKQHLGFSHDDSIHGPVIVVTNSATGEVIRKIPTEEVIRVAHSIDALKGVLYSTKI
jgi:flagellar protein FlaG